MVELVDYNLRSKKRRDAYLRRKNLRWKRVPDENCDHAIYTEVSSVNHDLCRARTVVHAINNGECILMADQSHPYLYEKRDCYVYRNKQPLYTNMYRYLFDDCADSLAGSRAYDDCYYHKHPFTGLLYSGNNFVLCLSKEDGYVSILKRIRKNGSSTICGAYHSHRDGTIYLDNVITNWRIVNQSDVLLKVKNITDDKVIDINIVTDEVNYHISYKSKKKRLSRHISQLRTSCAPGMIDHSGDAPDNLFDPTKTFEYKVLTMLSTLETHFSKSEYKETIKFLFRVSNAMYQIINAPNKIYCLSIIATQIDLFMQGYSDVAIYSDISGIKDQLFTEIRTHLVDPPGEAHVVVETVEYEDQSAHGAFTHTRAFLSGPLLQHFDTLACFFVTLGFVEPKYIKIGPFKAYQLECKARTHNCTTFCEKILTSVEYLFTTGMECFRSRSLQPMFGATNEVNALYNELTYLKAHINNVVTGTYEMHAKETEQYFITKLHQAIGQAKLLQNNVNNTPATSNLLVQILGSLATIENSVLSYRKTVGSRKEPFAIKLFGGTAVGKSVLLPFLARGVLTANNMPASDDNIIYMQLADAYDSNAKGNATCYIADDLANDFHKNEVTPSSSIVIRMVNTATTMAVMAEAEHKNTIPIEPFLFIATTNKQNLNAVETSNCPESILRRFHLNATVRVDTKYICKKNTMLDKAKLQKAPALPNGLKDIWSIDVTQLDDLTKLTHKIMPCPDWYSSYWNRPLLNNMTGKEFIHFAAIMSRRHDAEQIQRMTVNHNNKNTKICNKCNMQEWLCGCGLVTPDSPIDPPDAANIKKKNKKNLVDMSGLISSDDINSIISLGSWSYSLVFSAVRKSISSIIAKALPQPYEKTYIEKMVNNDVIMQFLGLHSISSNSFGWWNFTPSSLVVNPLFDDFFWYMERTTVIRRSLRMAQILGCLSCTAVCLPSQYRTVEVLGYSHTISRSTIGVCGLLTTAIGTRLIRAHNQRLLSDELRRRKITANAILSAATTTPPSMVNSVLRIGAYAAVSAGIVAVLRTVICTLKDQSALDPTSIDEVMTRDKTRNIWVRNRNIDIDKGTMVCGDLMNVVTKNIVNIMYTLPNGKSMTSSALLIDADHILMNKHVWYYINVDGDYKSDITGQIVPQMDFVITRNTNVHRGGSYKKTFYSSQVVALDNSDAVLVKGCVNGATTNLTDYFVTQAELPGYSRTTSAACVLRKVTGESNVFNVTCATQNVEYRRTNGMVRWPAFAVHSNYQWIKGDCGAVLISNTMPPRILGIHTLGYESTLGEMTTGISCTITNDMLLQVIKQDFHVTPLEDIPKHSCQQYVDHTLQAHSQHFVLNTDVANRAEFYGYVPNVPTIGSHVVATKFGTTLEKYGHGPNDWKGPCMRKYSSYEPYRVFYTKTMDHMGDIEYNTLERAKTDYVTQFTEQALKFKPILKDLYPLTNHEILNGRQGVKYMEGMNMQTAIGFPFKGKKSKHLVDQVYDDQMRLIYTLKKDKEFLWSEMEAFEEQLSQGFECYFPFISQVKDEIVPKIKKGVENVKVRIFQSSSLPLSFLLRKYFLPILRLFPMFPLHSECAVGLNCYSPEFSELFDSLTTNGLDDNFGGDYVAWDQKVAAQLSEAAYDCIMCIVEILNEIFKLYTPRDFRIMKTLKYAVCHAFIICFGIIMRLHASNPSGQTLTTFKNSIMNSIVTRCAFFDAYPDIVGRFRDYVRLATYGDDIIVSPQQNKRVPFNFQIMSKYMFKIKLGFTTDKKDSGEGVLSTPMHELTFLKRNFVYHPAINAVLGALDLKSMYKGLYNYVKKGKSDESNIVLSNIEMFAQELFAHGPYIYDLVLPRLREAAEADNYYTPQLHLTYAQRAKEWLAQYKPQDDYADYCQQEELRARNYPTLQTSPHDVLRRLSWVRDAEEIRPGNTFNNLREWLFKTTESSNHNTSVASDMSEHPSPEDQSGAVVHVDELAETPVVETGLIKFNSTAPQDVSIAKFLSRPVMLYDYTISTNVAFSASFKAVHDFIAVPSIAKKVAGYRFLAGNMNLIFTINGTIAHWGRYMASHDPWPTGSINTASNANQVFDIELFQQYQLQHVMIDCGTAMAGTMKFPILDPRDNKFDMRRASDVGNYPSRIRITSIAPLRVANGGSNSLSLKVYAFMTEVELSGALIDQSGELPNGPISAVATMGQHVTDVIGEAFSIQNVTKPVSVTLGAVSKVAAALGYSKPTVIASRMQNIPISTAGFAHHNDDIVTHKLSYDVKQSVSVDPASHGFAHEDQMALSYIAKKDHLCDIIPWYQPDTDGTYLYRMAIAPFHKIVGSGYHPSPAAWIAQPFRSFRGTCYIRVEIVASALHRGRLRVTYNPDVQLSDFSPPNLVLHTNESYSQIIDLTESRAYEFCIGWQAHDPWKSTASFNSSSMAAVRDEQTPRNLPTFNACNGTIAITVENELVLGGEPGTLLDGAIILVYSRWGDDFSVADPSDRIQDYRILDPVDQSADLGMTPSSTRNEHVKLCLNNSPEVLDDDNSIHMATMGERIYSVRQVVKRFTTSHAQRVNRASTSGQFFREADFPPFRGKSALRFPSQFGLSDPGGICNSSMTLFHWCCCPYLGFTGGIRQKIMFTPASEAFINVARVSSPASFLVTNRIELTTSERLHRIISSGCSGMALTTARMNSVLDVEFPFIANQRWRFVRPDKTSDSVSGSLVYDAQWHSVGISGFVASGGAVEFYIVSVAGADDFSLYQFKYIPVFTLLLPGEVPGEDPLPDPDPNLP